MENKIKKFKELLWIASLEGEKENLILLQKEEQSTIGRRLKRAKHRAEAATGGRIGKFGGGRTDLLEELGRVEGERSNPNRRAEISRVHSELNKGYKDGGRIGFKKGTDKKWMQKVSANQLKKEELKENVHRLQNQDVQDELKL